MCRTCGFRGSYCQCDRIPSGLTARERYDYGIHMHYLMTTSDPEYNVGQSAAKIAELDVLARFRGRR